MAGFQTMDMPRPRFAVGVPQAPRVNINLVRRRDERIEINPFTGFARITPTLIWKMRELRSEGLSLQTIADQLKTTKKTVYNFTRGVPAPAQGWNKGNEACVFDRAKAERMRRAGFSYQEIGEEFGLGKTAVRHRLCDIDWRDQRKTSQVKKPVERIIPLIYSTTKLKRIDIFRDPTAPRVYDRPQVVKARHLLFWLLHRRFGMTMSEAGEYLGGFDHSTVAHGISRVDRAVVSSGIDPNIYPMRIFRVLWSAKWPARNAA